MNVNEYWRSALISTTTLFFVTLSFRIFCLTVVHPYARHKSPSNITPPFPESYRTLATYFSRYYRLFFLKGTAAPFNYYAFFFHSGNCTVQQSFDIVNIFKSKCWNLQRKQEDLGQRKWYIFEVSVALLFVLEKC